MKSYLHFGSLYTDHKLPETKLEFDSIDSDVAFNLIKEELELETNEKQNLATFCQTYMEPEADQLIQFSLSKNAIDKTEYPKVTEFENRCLNIIEYLWNGENTIGTSTIGSSEACMLAGINMKKRWQKANPNLTKPNLIISSAYQVCWEKFAVYFDVELKIIPITKKSLTLNIDEVIDSIDENTIGIIGIVGVTYTGLIDKISYLDTKLTEYNETAKFPIYIHVDAASGGFYLPFINRHLIWDFRLENVISINASGHKSGLTYPGIDWILFKNDQMVEQEILFDVAYLGGNVSTMGINFSHSASHIVAQYYNFSRFGFSGYRKIHQKTREVAKYIYAELNKLNIFSFYNTADNMPILCYTLKDNANFNLYALSDELLKSSWQVPTYELPDDLNNITIQRIVIRADFSFEYAKNLVTDIKNTVNKLQVNQTTIAKSNTFIH